MREGRHGGPFNTIRACLTCFEIAVQKEKERVTRRERRGGTCDACKRRPGTIGLATNMTPTMAYKSEKLCAECYAARIRADVDQAAEAIKRFKDAPAEPWPAGDDQE